MSEQVTNSMSQAEMEAYWRAVERERIIKLLEAMRCGCGSTECPHIMDAIDLIKGENK